MKAGVLRRAQDGVRLLGNGELKAKVDFEVHGASKSAHRRGREGRRHRSKILAPPKPAEPEARPAASRAKPEQVEAARPSEEAGRAKKTVSWRSPSEEAASRRKAARAPYERGYGRGWQREQLAWPRQRNNSRPISISRRFAKAEELKKRIWFTLGALIVYRLGTYIPLPGIDPSRLAQIFRSQAGGILGMFNMFAGGAHRAHGDLRAQHHAVHLGLDHHPADDHGLAARSSS